MHGYKKMAEARCGCGAIVLKLNDASPAVVACHCIDCQRRTGAPFGVGAYFPANEVRISGEAKEYARSTANGGVFRSYFCPNCGSSVYWKTDKHPAMIGVAVGAISDPSFPGPVRSVWEQSKHDWVQIHSAAQHFSRGRDS